VVTPVLVALDVPTLAEAETLAGAVQGHVGGFKVGLELVMAEGPRAIRRIAARGLPVLADVKLHDIPNTVRRAASRVRAAGARWVTAHAAGGGKMLDAALAGMGGERGVLAVTVLTSLGDADLAAAGADRSTGAQVELMARLADDRGAEGVVCSPREAASVKEISSRLLVATPGIRPHGASIGDQRRTAAPVEALRSGADLLVIGRAITSAPDPAAAAAAIASDIAAGTSGYRQPFRPGPPGHEAQES